MKGEILVAGVGNIFLGDDAFGVEVVRKLATLPLPRNVQVTDFGTRSYDLAYALMQSWELVILVDAMPRGETPGTVYAIEVQMPPTASPLPAFAAHSMNPLAILHLVGKLGADLDRILLVGCEPASVEPDPDGRIALSPPVEAALDEAIRMIGELIARARNAAA